MENTNDMPSIFIEQTCSNPMRNTKFKVRARSLTNDPIRGQKTRTFTILPKAKSFKKKLEIQFKKGDYSFFDGVKKRITIRAIIFDYLSNPATIKHIKSRTTSLLKRIATESPIQHISAENLEGHHWYVLAQFMVEDWKVKPQTAANYLSTLKSTLNNCKIILRYQITLSGYSDGVTTAKTVGYLGKSEARTRRMNKDEQLKIEQALMNEQQTKRRSIPMLDIFNVASNTALRLGEICGKITWNDLDKTQRILTIRNRKTPKKGTTITSRFQLSQQSFNILINQPKGKDSDPIFPYNSESVGSAWRCLIKELNIHDLHFHDLRAEALCRLYENGMSLVEISKISGHKDLNILNNFYLRLFPTEPSRLTI